MDRECRREARRQFFHYFRFWFPVVGVMAVVCLALGAARALMPGAVRGNQTPGADRVFDYADVLTYSEEDALEEYIARCENRYRFDIVVVTVNEDVESLGNWERVMESYADDFYDERGFGYDRIHGDGILILDNWYEGQEGTHLSTAGRAEAWFTYGDVDRVLDAVEERVESDPYAAYKAAVDAACRVMGSEKRTWIPWPLVILLPVLAAVVFAAVNLRQVPAQDTTAPTAYVAGGKPTLREQRDDFIRKSVVTTRIATDSPGGSGHSGGYAGSHRSAGGVRHGGGGRRR